MKTTLLAAFVALFLSGLSRAQLVNYSESISGDLSNNAAAPTVFDFSPGQNTIAGSMGRPNGQGPIDRDIFTFHVEPWERVTALTILAYSPQTTPGVIGSFLAISSSTTINLTNPSTHLSNILVTGPGEILPLLAAGSYSNSLGTQPLTEGLVAPLGTGDYTVWFQELSTVVNYRLGVTLTAVPEPSTYAWATGALLAAFCLVRRWRRRSASEAL